MPNVNIPLEVIEALSWLEGGVLLVLALAWAVTGWLSEHPFPGHPSVTMMMAEVRREWMREYLTRDNPIADTQAIASLRQGTTLLASTSILGVGGVLALIGNVTPIAGLAAEVGREDVSALLWQIKLLPCALILTHAFLQFIWADRVYSQCLVMMASVPYQASDPQSLPRAMRAADLNISAAHNYNRGLRSMYFALASLAWLVSAPALLLATVLVTWSLWHREFTSVLHDIPVQN